MNQLFNLIIAIILTFSVGVFSKHEINVFKKEVIKKVDQGLAPLTPMTSKLTHN